MDGGKFYFPNKLPSQQQINQRSIDKPTAITKFVFDSDKRYTGTNDNPVFSIPNGGIKASQVFVNMINIPHSFFNINTSNNSFVWTDASSATHTSSVPIGDYTASELLTALETAMDADTTDGLTYSWTVDDASKKITVTNSGPSVFSLDMANSALPNPSALPKMLGFLEIALPTSFFGDDAIIQAMTGASSYTGNAVFWVGSPRSLYIRSSLGRSSRDYNSYAFVNGLNPLNGFYIDQGKNDILEMVPVTTVWGQNIHHYPKAENLVIPLNPNESISTISFEIEDQNYAKVSLNGQPFVIELIFMS